MKDFSHPVTAMKAEASAKFAKKAAVAFLFACAVPTLLIIAQAIVSAAWLGICRIGVEC